MLSPLQEKMFHEIKLKSIFRLAEQYAFNYADTVRECPVYPKSDAIADLDNFVEELPDATGNAVDVLEQLNRYGTPASVAQTGGRYFGFVTGGVIPASLAARWLSDFWDQNTALYVMSPIAAKLEEVCESWLKTLFGLPQRVVAGFVSGSSAAILCGLAAARYRILHNNGWNINTQGFYGAPRIRIIAGRQAHAAVIKAIALLGFGTDTIEWVKTDAQGKMILSEIPKLDERTILILQAGNVGSGAFDAFDTICEKADRSKAWVHIDGAFGLWAAASKRLIHLTKGIEKADSFSVDGHKTLNMPYDSGMVLCNDQKALTHALHASGSYITYSEERDGMLYTPEMSRRARVVELWAALKYLGKKGVDDLVYGLHQRALQMARELEAENFRILNEVVFNQVLAACDSDAITDLTMRYIQESGECWVGGAHWNQKVVIRISICSWATTEDDITRSVTAFVAARNKAVQEIKPSCC